MSGKTLLTLSGKALLTLSGKAPLTLSGKTPLILSLSKGRLFDWYASSSPRPGCRRPNGLGSPLSAPASRVYTRQWRWGIGC